jgi:hypothetical protein
MVNQKETINLESISNMELFKEIYKRVKAGEVIIRVKKWRSKYGGLNKVKVIFIGEKKVMATTF